MSSALVAAMVADARASGDARWLRANCLACPERVSKTDQKRSFAFNTSTGLYRCMRCGLWGYARHLASGTAWGGASEADRPLGGEPLEASELPRGFYLLEEEPARSSQAARPAISFLDRRGIAAETRRRLGIGACLVPGGSRSCVGRDYYGRIIVPIRDSAGVLRGYVARAWDKKHPTPYLYPKGFARGEIVFGHEELWRKTDEPLLVVEGVLDAAYLGPGAVPALGIPSPEQLAVMAESERPIVLVLDGDAWLRGYALAQQARAAQAASGRRPSFSALRLPGGTDPDEYPPEVVWEAARQAARGEI